jgi:hypothetical protein
MGNAWRDVEAGRRKLDWAVAIGDPTELDFLTPLGRQTAARMIDDLEKFFGPGWLNKAVHPACGVAGPTMGPYFASLAGVGAFRCVVGLWARLQFLVHTETAGIGILRRNLQANPVADEFRHHTALARLAVQAHLVGARVTLEPKKPEGGPGDLRAVRAGSDVFIELRTLGPDKAFQTYNRNVDRAQAYLRQLEFQLDGLGHGDLPREPTAVWVVGVTSAAAKAAATTTAVDVVHDGVVLTVRPGPAAVGTEITGPTWESDQGPRLVRALVVKAVKTASAGAAWLWLEDAGALWPLSSFAQDPLAQKAQALRHALEPLFDAHPHVLGVVLTSSEQRIGGDHDLADRVDHRGTAIRRGLPNAQVRDSVVVHRRLAVPGQYGLVVEMCTGEPMWLDRALQALGVPGGLAALTTQATQVGGQPMANRRRASGPYLPS